MKHLVLAAITATLCAFTAMAQSPTAPGLDARYGEKDVVGIRVGMSISDALSAIKKHDASLKIKEIKQPIFEGSNESYLLAFDARSANLVGKRSDGSSQGEVIWVEFVGKSPSGDPKVVGISRKVFYAKADRPIFTSVSRAIEDKYGRDPTYRSGNIMTSYSYLSDGRLVPPTDATTQSKNACQTLTIAPVIIRSDEEQAEQLPTWANSGCGINIEVKFMTDFSDNLVDSLSVVVYGSKLEFDWLKYQETAKKEEDDRKERELLDKAQKKSPGAL